MDKKPKKKDQIIDAAALLFQRKGFKSSSIRDIAESVKIEPSSIYSHFKSKEEILIIICMRCAHMYSDELRTIQAKNISTIDKIKALISAHIRIALDEPSSATVFSDEWRHLPKSELEDFLKARKNYEQSFSKLIEKRIQEKNLKFNAEFIVKSIISSVRWLHLSRSKFTKSERLGLENDIEAYLSEPLL